MGRVVVVVALVVVVVGAGVVGTVVTGGSESLPTQEAVSSAVAASTDHARLDMHTTLVLSAS